MPISPGLTMETPYRMGHFASRNGMKKLLEWARKGTSLSTVEVKNRFWLWKTREEAAATHAVFASLCSPNLWSCLLQHWVPYHDPVSLSCQLSSFPRDSPRSLGRLEDMQYVLSLSHPILMSDSPGSSHELGPGCTTSLRNPGLRQPQPVKSNSWSSVMAEELCLFPFACLQVHSQCLEHCLACRRPFEN